MSFDLQSPGGTLNTQPFFLVLDVLPLTGANILVLPGEPGALAVSANYVMVANSLDGSGIIPITGSLGSGGFQVNFSLPYVRTTGDLVLQALVLDPAAPNGVAVTPAAGGRFGNPPTITPIFGGSQVLDQFGYSVTVADLDQDGTDELICGSLEQDSGGQLDVGKVSIYTGLPPVLQYTLEDPAPETSSQFGVSTSVADLNGDGHLDVVVGAREYDALGLFDSGRVVVFFGPAFTATQVLLPTAPEARGQFGHRSACGDFDGDGYADVAIGAIGQASGGFVQAGTVEVFFGPTLTTHQLIPNPTPGTGDRFGYRLEARDFDQDGFCDLAVASPFKTLTGSNDDSGALHILQGPLLTSSTYFPNPMPSPQGLLGADIAFEDLDNDGFLDLVGGAELEDVGATLQAGGVYILNGPTYSSYTHRTAPIPTTDGGFGSGVAIGDYDGDGIKDLMIGEFWFQLTFYRQGQAHILLGPDYTTAISVLEPNAGSSHQFGRRVDAGDLDGDGDDEMIVGVPLSSAVGVQRAGAVYIIQG